MWISTNSNWLTQVSKSKTASIYCWFSKLNPQNIVDFYFYTSIYGVGRFKIIISGITNVWHFKNCIGIFKFYLNDDVKTIWSNA